MRRVVITGMSAISAISAIGDDVQEIMQNLAAQKSAVRIMPEWEKYVGLNTKLAAPIDNFIIPEHFSRKQLRSMSRVSIMSIVAAEQALKQAQLLNDPLLKSGQLGIAFGSSVGSTQAVGDFGSMLINFDTKGINATTYVRMMSHTAAVNMGVYFGIQGRIIPTSSACTSGSQGLGYAYESIKFGMQDIMLAGGAEELCATEATVFDTLYATSIKNNAPQTTPSPFDQDRDGLVIGEGAGVFVLEEYEHAKVRGATILAEIAGFACNSDGCHITQPNSTTMQKVIELALQNAQIPASVIGYISAHGTATEHGDIAESNATARVFANKTPISALKSYLGHSLGACGAIEAMVAILMMKEKSFHPTLNLRNIDSRCGDLDYIINNHRHIDTEYIISNNFAFGGINTSLVFKQL